MLISDNTLNPLREYILYIYSLINIILIDIKIFF